MRMNGKKLSLVEMGLLMEGGRGTREVVDLCILDKPILNDGQSSPRTAGLHCIQGTV